MDKKTKASAPTKLILFGEHFVVYGAPGIAIPVDRRNSVEVEPLDVDGNFEVRWGGRNTAVGGGNVSGDRGLAVFHEAYSFIMEKFGEKTGIRAGISSDGACKGMGNSSSIGAALGLAMAGCLGHELDKDGAFECAQRVDWVAHGGRPSGIDARTVVEGRPQRFMRNFSPASFVFREVNFRLPRDYVFVVVDTFRGARLGTGELIGLFAEAVGAKEKPENMSERQRRLVCRQYEGLCERMAFGPGKANVPLVAKLMNENHMLLKERGVSADEVEEARDLCLHAGAVGAKISGAGGPGGALLVLVENKKMKDVIETAVGAGFKAFGVNVAERGAVKE